MWPPLRWNSFGAPTPCWHWWARSHSCRHRALPHFSLGVAETCQIGYIYLHLPVFSKPLGVDPALSLYSYGCLSFNFRSLSGSFRYAHPLRAQIPPWRALISWTSTLGLTNLSHALGGLASYRGAAYRAIPPPTQIYWNLLVISDFPMEPRNVRDQEAWE